MILIYLKVCLAENGQQGTCCAPKIPQYTACRGHTVCQELSQCETGYEFDSIVDSRHFNDVSMIKYWNLLNTNLL